MPYSPPHHCLSLERLAVEGREVGEGWRKGRERGGGGMEEGKRVERWGRDVGREESREVGEGWKEGRE